jgi:hypothetical protein
MGAGALSACRSDRLSGVGLILLPFFVACGVVSTTPAAAQQFLACSHTEAGTPAIGAGPATIPNERWLHDSREILHAFAGDDLTAYFGFRPRIHITNQASPNAFAVRPDSIVVSSALLHIIDSTSEFAFVIAHELGHLVLDRKDSIHSFAPLEATAHDPVAHEVAADTYAIELLQSAGFDPSAGRALLTKIGGATVRAGVSMATVFPSIPARLSAMASLLKEPPPG